MKRKTVNKLLMTTLATAVLCTAGGIATSTTHSVSANTPTSINDVAFDMIYGASIRVGTTENPNFVPGIRFSAKMSVEHYNWLMQTYGEDNVEFGTIIMPSSYNDSVTANEESLFGNTATYYWEGKTVKTETKEVLQMDSAIYEYTDEKTNETYMRVNGSIGPVLQKNYNKEFFGVCYMAINTGNSVQYVCATEDDNDRSLVYVAQRAIEKEGWATNSVQYTTAKNFIDTYIADYKKANENQMPTVQYTVNKHFDDGSAMETETYYAELGSTVTLNETDLAEDCYVIDTAKSTTSGTAYAQNKLVLDVYYKKSVNQVVPTLDQAKAGFTYDWVNTYMYVENAPHTMVKNIENAEAKSAIENATSGFNSAVVHLTNSTATLAALHKDLNADLFQKGWIYTFEIDYYAVSADNIYMLAFDGTQSNNAFKHNPFSAGLGKAVFEYKVGATDFNLCFYTAGGTTDVYIGNFKLTVREPEVERTDFHSVTNEEMIAEGGYTYNWSENNILEFSANATYVKLSSMQDTTLANTLTATGAFTNGYAMKFAGINDSYIPCLEGVFQADYKYTVSFDAYVVTMGSVTILAMSAGGQAGRHDFNVTDNTDGTKHFTTTFTAKADYLRLNLYIITECEWYLANINFTAIEPEIGLVDKDVTGSKAYTELNIGGKGTVGTATPENAVGKKGFGDSVISFTNVQLLGTAGYAELFTFGSTITGDANFKSVDVTIYYYLSDDFVGDLRLMYGGSFPNLETSAGYHAVTINLTAIGDFVCLHLAGGNASNTAGTMYIGSIEYVIHTQA